MVVVVVLGREEMVRLGRGSSGRIVEQERESGLWGPPGPVTVEVQQVLCSTFVVWAQQKERKPRKKLLQEEQLGNRGG